MIFKIIEYFNSCSLDKGADLSDDYVLADYCDEALRARKNENVFIVALDHKNRLIGSRYLGEGDYSSVSITAAQVAKYAMTCGGKILVVVHNHPHGSAMPSSRDFETAETICEGVKQFGVFIRDHLVIGEDGVFSMTKRKFITRYLD